MSSAAAPILPAPATIKGADTFASALGVGERLNILIDTPREGAAPSVADDEVAAGKSAAIQITIQHLGPAVGVSAPTARPDSQLGRRSSPQKGHGNPTHPSVGGRGGGSRSRPDGDGSRSSSQDGERSSSSSRNGRGRAANFPAGYSSSSSNDVESDYHILEKKPRTLQDEMQGVFDILVLVMGALIPIALLAYALLPEDNVSAHRTAWITISVVVGLAVVGAVISRLAVTETAAEVSSTIGVVCTVVVIIVSEIVLAKCLPYDFSTIVWGVVICVIFLLADIYAWTEYAGRPKYLRNGIRGFPSCFHSCIMGLISFCDKWLL